MFADEPITPPSRPPHTLSPPYSPALHSPLRQRQGGEVYKQRENLDCIRISSSGCLQELNERKRREGKRKRNCWKRLEQTSDLKCLLEKVGYFKYMN